jgi:DNA repair exonuclease SbcCD nuclease subunit
MFRFIHSSDLHLGKRYGNIMSEDLRGRLREARHVVIRTLGQCAETHSATAVLLAGDTFDTETPTPEVLRQALAEMRHHAALTWVLLPGNHDSLQATELWRTLTAEAPDNVILAVRPEPILLDDGVAILPAPCSTRRPGRDLTEWMDDAATPDGVARIGLAHGAVQDFSEEGNATDVLAIDRAARAGLDYLALGDWHGALALNDRTQYSGAPEPDRFKHDRPGQALVVTIAGPGATPQIEPAETGAFAWTSPKLHLLPDLPVESALAEILPPGPERRQTLLHLVVEGRASIAQRMELETLVAHAAPEFAQFETDMDGLETEIEVTDLDVIDHAGALRVAAESLLGQSEDVALSDSDRQIAQAALRRLFSLVRQVAE